MSKRPSKRTRPSKRPTPRNLRRAASTPLDGGGGGGGGDHRDSRRGGVGVDPHWAKLSGAAAREKQARREILSALREDAQGDVRVPLLSQTADQLLATPGPGALTPGGALLPAQPVSSSSSSSFSSSATASAAPPPATRHPRHSYVYRLLSGRSRHAHFVAFNRALAVLILVTVVAFVLESFPDLAAEDSGWQPWFYGIEAVSSSIFLVEYVARLATIHESRYYRKRYGGGGGGGGGGRRPGGLRSTPRKCAARARYACTVRAGIDLASCLPFFVELCVPGHDLPTLSWLRLFRLFRILKSERTANAFSSVYRVVWYNSEILSIALFIGLLLMMATSTVLWYLQPPGAGEQFASIPATFYLSILMLTGQGVPDGVLPWYTKVIVMLTAVFSVPIFVIPSSMLTWGFEAEAERLMRKKRARRRKEKEAARTGVPVASSSSSSGGETSDSDDSDAVWDEYEDVVLGSDGAAAENGAAAGGKGGAGAGGISEEERRLIKDVSRFFAAADVDGSGQLSVGEFFKFTKAMKSKTARENQRKQQEQHGGGGGGGGGRARRRRRRRSRVFGDDDGSGSSSDGSGDAVGDGVADLLSTGYGGDAEEDDGAGGGGALRRGDSTRLARVEKKLDRLLALLETQPED